MPESGSLHVYGKKRRVQRHAPTRPDEDGMTVAQYLSAVMAHAKQRALLDINSMWRKATSN